MRPWTNVYEQLLLLGCALVIVSNLACGGSSAGKTQQQTVANSQQGSAAEGDQPEKLSPGNHKSGQGDELMLVLAQVNPVVAECGKVVHAVDRSLHGELVMSVEIGEENTTRLVKSVSDTIAYGPFAICVRKVWQSVNWPSSFSPGDKVQVPYELKSKEAQYAVQTRHVTPKIIPHAEGDKSIAQVLLTKRNTGNEAAGLALLHVDPCCPLAFSTKSATELFFVVAGQGTLTSAGAPHTLNAGSAALIPAQVATGISAKQPLRILQLFVSAGAERHYLRERGSGVQVLTPQLLRKNTKSGDLAMVRSVDSAKSYEIADGKANVRFLFDRLLSGRQEAYMGALSMQPGLSIPEHTHENETEILYIVEGGGGMLVNSELLQVNAGTAIQVPPNTPHAFVNGTVETKAIQFYTPSGPEQRFKGASK